MRYITAAEVLEIHSIQVDRFGGDPSADSAQVVGCIEAAISLPRQHVFGTELYPSIAEKAAAYLFFLAKRHCFTDGNKRTALNVALLFLAINGHVLDSARTTPRLAAQLTLDIAAGRCEQQQVVRWFRKRLRG